MRNTGLPSATFAASLVISMPRIGLPSTLGFARVSGRTRPGYFTASASSSAFTSGRVRYDVRPLGSGDSATLAAYARSAAAAARIVAARSASSTRQVNPAARSFCASAAECSTTSTPVRSPCSVVSSPSALTRVRSCWLAAATCTTCTLSSGAVGAAVVIPAPARRTAVASAPAAVSWRGLTGRDVIGCSWVWCGRCDDRHDARPEPAIPHPERIAPSQLYVMVCITL